MRQPFSIKSGCYHFLQIKRGEKVALTGENGTGKSTLIKEIFKGANPQIDIGRFVKLALYDQEGANLNGDNTVLSELWERHVGLTQTEVRSALARCGLYEEDMEKPVKSLSGGERAKLALCILECEKGNFLLLDEPTNHLDLPARESLEKALISFDGTILFVSHDRYFISAIAQKVVEIEDGKFNVYDGGYAFYTEEKKRKRELARQSEEGKRRQAAKEEKQTSYRSKKERAEEERKKTAIKQIERKISALEDEEERLNAQLADPAVSADYKKVNEILERLHSIKLQTDKLYNEYSDML